MEPVMHYWSAIFERAVCGSEAVFEDTVHDENLLRHITCLVCLHTLLEISVDLIVRYERDLEMFLNEKEPCMQRYTKDEQISINQTHKE